jgi:hypothetical protein
MSRPVPPPKGLLHRDSDSDDEKDVSKKKTEKKEKQVRDVLVDITWHPSDPEVDMPKIFKTFLTTSEDAELFKWAAVNAGDIWIYPGIPEDSDVPLREYKFRFNSEPSVIAAYKTLLAAFPTDATNSIANVAGAGIGSLTIDTSIRYALVRWYGKCIRKKRYSKIEWNRCHSPIKDLDLRRLQLYVPSPEDDDEDDSSDDISSSSGDDDMQRRRERPEGSDGEEDYND